LEANFFDRLAKKALAGGSLVMERIDQPHQPSVPPRILIVTARRLLVEGLQCLFREQMNWPVLWADSVDNGIKQALGWRPDVTIVDLSLPDGGGLLLYQQLQAQRPKMRVVFLDDSLQQSRLAAVQRLQAPGYFTLRDSFEYLVAGLRQILAGRAVYPAGAEVFVTKPVPGTGPALCQTLPNGAPAGQKEKPISPLSRLSRREMEVLIHLVRGLTVEQCAKQLHLSPNTVDNHKARLMRKLGIHRSVDLIRLALQEKLVE
jgi:DNA-binding NarL/FixJ family response regulator